MTIDLGDGSSITVDTFKGKTWLCVRSKGGGITVSMDDKPALEVSTAITAGVIQKRGHRDRGARIDCDKP